MLLDVVCVCAVVSEAVCCVHASGCGVCVCAVVSEVVCCVHASGCGVCVCVCVCCSV